MKWIHIAGAAVCLASLAGVAAGDGAAPGPPVSAGCGCCPPPFIPGAPTPGNPMPGTNPAPGTNPTPGANPAESQPSTLSGEAFNRGSEAGTQTAASVAPAFFGDQIGPIPAQGNVFTPPQITGPNGAAPATPLRGLSGNVAAVVAPVPLDAAYKIAENESPRPQDRVYVGYNFYDDVDQSLRAFGVGRADLQRETVGLEKTFDQGESSFGVRLPVVQLTGDNVVQDDELGDLSLIYKHAILDDPRTGDLLSAGLLLTLPTERKLYIAGESSVNSTLFQPFVGFIYNFDSWYFEGFESVAVPTDMRDVTLLFSSLGVGYNLYVDDCPDAPVRYVRPQLEIHVNTPLTHRGLTSTPIGFPDAVDLTSGVRVLFRQLEFGAAAGTSVTGPKVYDVEAFANVTYHF